MVAALVCAEAASEGAHFKNASRDLLKKFLTPSQEWPKFYMASLPFEHGDFDIPFCLPHMFVEQKILDKEEWQLAAGSPMHRHVGSAVQGPVQRLCVPEPLGRWSCVHQDCQHVPGLLAKLPLWKPKQGSQVT